jgi:glutathione S-transferase
MEDLVMYYSPTCPYSIKVLEFMKERGIEIELRDRAVLENRAELIRVGGKRQVPCLIIDGKPLYESKAIIEYLDKRFH